MQMLSEDDLNLREMTDEELDAAWDLWFDLAQETNEFDPALHPRGLCSDVMNAGELGGVKADGARVLPA